MIWALLLLGAGLAVELLPYTVSVLWRGRKVTAITSMMLTLAGSGFLLGQNATLFSALFVGISLYRAFNALRLFEGRMHDRYLRKATLRTSLVLVLFQVAVAAAWVAWDRWHNTGHVVWGGIAAVQCTGAMVLLATTVRNLRRTEWPASAQALSDAELPTVSVAIPARNETDDLQACLQSVIASDYPKLEILVLDDCSQNRRTPEIIRAYAHDGVRFIQGEVPAKTWLPKNQAYHKLAHEASGQYVLYCGADMRFAPDTIRQMVTMLLERNKKMLSLLPEREPAATGRAVLVQAMRYWWELVPPRRLFNRPPVLSSCWLIEAAALKEAGGFKAVARSIVPEAYFAKRLLALDGYSFRRGDSSLGLRSAKSAADQRDTAVRTRYPQLHRRPEQVCATIIAECAFLIMPFVLAMAGIWISVGVAAQLLAIVASICLAVSYVLVAHSTRINQVWFAIFALPLVVATDIALVHYSMWRYEFSSVEWRGRNVCVPVMHVVPHLPKI